LDTLPCNYETKTGSVTIQDEDKTENVTLITDETDTYTLTFVVKDESGNPIVGANIETMNSAEESFFNS
jgi:hypothetical protein